jgi:hypothetical protein
MRDARPGTSEAAIYQILDEVSKATCDMQYQYAYGVIIVDMHAFLDLLVGRYKVVTGRLLLGDSVEHCKDRCY